MNFQHLESPHDDEDAWLQDSMMVTMQSLDEDHFVLVEEEDDDDDADEGFVITNSENQDEEPFLLIADTLDSVVEEQNNENAHTRESAKIILSLIVSYLYALMSLTMIVALLLRQPWQTKTTTSSRFADVVEPEDISLLSEVHPVPTTAPVFIPTRAHSPQQPFVGYPVVAPRSFSDVALSSSSVDYAVHRLSSSTALMPSPSPQVDQVRYSAIAYASPPKVEPILLNNKDFQVVSASPFPSIAAPWKQEPRQQPASKALVFHLPTLRRSNNNMTHEDIPAPKARPILLPRNNITTAVSIPTVMRIPFAPTFHIPHARPVHSSLLPTEQQHTATIPTTAPLQDLLSLETVIAFFTHSASFDDSALWKEIEEQVVSVPTVRVDCSAPIDDALDRFCDAPTPSVHLLRYGRSRIGALPLHDGIVTTILKTLSHQSNKQVMTTHTPVSLRSTPLTSDSFQVFIETHRFSIVVFYHPTIDSNDNKDVWKIFHRHQGPGRATVNCQAFPTICGDKSNVFPRLQRYRYGRAVVMVDDGENENAM